MTLTQFSLFVELLQSQSLPSKPPKPSSKPEPSFFEQTQMTEARKDLSVQIKSY